VCVCARVCVCLVCVCSVKSPGVLENRAEYESRV
jgi:hypothetical protein